MDGMGRTWYQKCVSIFSIYDMLDSLSIHVHIYICPLKMISGFKRILRVRLIGERFMLGLGF